MQQQLHTYILQTLITMGNSPSSPGRLDMSMNFSGRHDDPAKVGIEADFEKLGARIPTVVPDAVTEEDHQRRSPRRSSFKPKNRSSVSERDPARVGMESDLEHLGLAPAEFDECDGEEAKLKLQKSKRNGIPASVQVDDKRPAGKLRAAKKKERATSTSMQNHMTEIEAFLIAVQNDRKAKKQLKQVRQSLAVGTQ